VDLCLSSPNGNLTIYFDPGLSNHFLSGHTISGGGGMVMKSGMKPDITPTYQGSGFKLLIRMKAAKIN
jgi:hypothetical protein